MRGEFKHSFKAEGRAELPLLVYNAGFQKCTPGYDWGPGVRDHYLIHYIVSGKGRCEIEGRPFVLFAGDVFLVPPETVVYYRADQELPWEYYWVGFAGAGAAVLLAATPLAAKRPVLAAPHGERLRRALLEIYKARGSDYASAVRMAGYLQVALGLLMAGTPPAGEDNLERYAHSGAVYIQQNYFRAITVEEVAEQIGVSRSYLYRAFQSCFQCAPSVYLGRYRMERACQLLRHSALAVGAVALSVGYEDGLYFSRAFRKALGVSPSAYRLGR